MHQRIPFLGTAVVPIYSASGKPINCEFHVLEDSSYSLIGLKVIHELGVSVCLLLPSSTTSHEEINKLLTTCDNATGGMTIDPIHLETEGNPIFLKRRILPYWLREPVHKELMKLQNEGIIHAVNSSLWACGVESGYKTLVYCSAQANWWLPVLSEITRETYSDTPEERWRYTENLW